jgi:uncharacterized membrane protein YfcA
MTWAAFAELAALGVSVGAFGTLVGAGGGFVLAPALLLLYPRESPATITSISLAVVFFNALSGSAAYARAGRIDYWTGRRFALATVPGAVLGAVAVNFIPRGLFDLIFALVLFGLSGFVFARAAATEESGDGRCEGRGRVRRSVTDAEGQTYSYCYDMRLGLLLSAGVGFLSSLLGIGGGIVHVPVLVAVLDFPAHIATATSHFVLAIMALAGTVVHVVNGEFTTGWRRTGALAVGVTVGAQLGARLAPRVRGALIMRLLALALLGVGARLLLLAL